MNDPRAAFFAEMDDIIADALFINTDNCDLAEELRTNTWRITLSLEQSQHLTQADLRAFLDDLITARQAQVAVSSSPHGMIFYLWHDAQANQLRFSLISDTNTALPFKRTVRILPDPGPILDAFLSDSGPDLDNDTLPPLDVYTVSLKAK